MTARTPTLEALFRPRSIAIVGASARGGPGAKMLSTLRAGGFDAPVWCVSQTAKEIEGYPCFPSLADLPATPDCLLVAVPGEAVNGVLESASSLQIRSALVVSEGFADAGTEEGRARQDALVAIASGAQMAVAGPNSIGLACLGRSMVATMTDLVPAHALKGTISIVSQSGGLMLAASELCANRGIGLEKLISIGNQAVIELADYLDYLAADDDTRVIGLIIEGVKNGRRFRAALERASRRKPVVMLKLGRSELGQAATLAHTGTLAGKDEAFVALFHQCGAALVRTIDDFVETCALFDRAPIPAGDRVCMLTISGGATSLISDNGAAAGVHFPPVGADTNKALQQIIGVERDFANPIDSVGLARLLKEGALAQTISVLLADPNVDVIGLVIPFRLEANPVQTKLIESLRAAAAGAAKPIVAISFMSNSLNARWRGYAHAHGLPLMEDVGAAMRAIKRLVDYGAFRRKAATTEALHDKPHAAIAAGRTLTEAESKIVLGEAALRLTREFLAETPAEAGRRAKEAGVMLAIKVQSADIPHKSDVGGVALRVLPADAESAARLVLENAARACPQARIDGVLVQEMIDDGVEFILGMTYDEQFGPMIVLGAGGVQVELFQDSSVRLPPLRRDDVVDMLSELKISKVLTGFRGAPPRDVGALIACCLAFSDFVCTHDGRFAAIDINPLLVRPDGKGVVIADALIVLNRDA